MRRLLVVSPRFPPVSAPDMQRVRISLPHFADSGWEPFVLAVDPEGVEGVVEPLLLETVPRDVPIRHVRPVSARWTRRVGVGDLGLRSFRALYRAGCDIIRKHGIDLVYFSTTVFTVLPLGRLWKRRLGVSFVVDLQDPWVSDYYEGKAKNERPPKYRLARAMHTVLEPWTMPEAAGLVAVTPEYIDTLQKRYPRLRDVPHEVIPMGASEADFDLVGRLNLPNPFFQPGDGHVHGVYAGVLGPVMRPTCRALCAALRMGLDRWPALFSRVRLHFIGTDYDPAAPRASMLPLAEEVGVRDFVHEEPARSPYFKALRTLLDADFLLLVGSDNPQYTASKLYPYILARRPLLAIFHEKSSVVDVLGRTGAGEIVTFADGFEPAELAQEVVERWRSLLERIPFRPETRWAEFEPYLAGASTRRQCALFDRVARA
jgi:hypothetical protein